MAAADRNGLFALDVRTGLAKAGQKELPSKYLYDEIGSALFEAITHLPEYGLTRAEERLLQRHASDLPGFIPHPPLVVELGSGNGRKARWILESLAHGGPFVYYPVDVSPSALLRCRQELGGMGAVTIVGVQSSFLEGLQLALSNRRPGQSALVLFLGSTIGNFDREAGGQFLAAIRRQLLAGDVLLLGADLEKPISQMLLAYDDPAGVTAAFNLNLLGRINRELGGDFNLRHFSHQAVYNPRERRIEMHIRSVRPQTVSIPAAGLTLALRDGETIWTESCHKYAEGELRKMAEEAGFSSEAQWMDEHWPFALSVWVARDQQVLPD